MSAPTLELSIALSDNARTRPLLEGRVMPQGIRLTPTRVHPSEMFWRQLRYGDFDVSEMSMSSLIISVSHGVTDWVAIPVYTMRQFFHTRILVRADAGITAPADLKGKRVGVPEYQQTSAIWSRGVLQHEFGVKPSDIEWFMERGADKSHAGSGGFRPPHGVRLNQIPPHTNIGEMLVRGELDATLMYLRDNNLVDRSRIDVSADANIRRLFPDIVAEGSRYYDKTGIYPINHTVVVRRSLLDRHPWIALNLYSAFLAAKAELAVAADAMLQGYYETGLIAPGLQERLKADPMAYGVKAARPVLETIAQFVHEQGLTARRVAIEELFAPSTMEV
jgi:4,5-dihydroxyphthalate decarboxylase